MSKKKKNVAAKMSAKEIKDCKMSKKETIDCKNVWKEKWLQKCLQKKKGLQKPESVQMWKENLLSVEC